MAGARQVGVRRAPQGLAELQRRRDGDRRDTSGGPDGDVIGAGAEAVGPDKRVVDGVGGQDRVELPVELAVVAVGAAQRHRQPRLDELAAGVTEHDREGGDPGAGEGLQGQLAEVHLRHRRSGHRDLHADDGAEHLGHRELARAGLLGVGVLDRDPGQVVPGRRVGRNRHRERDQRLGARREAQRGDRRGDPPPGLLHRRFPVGIDRARRLPGEAVDGRDDQRQRRGARARHEHLVAVRLAGASAALK